jgi:hypothetical protein
MKLSLISAAAVAAIAALAVACDDSAGANDSVAKNPAAEPPATPAATPAAQPRQLVAMPALATSPQNLLLDPGFGLVSQQASFGSFLALVDGTFDQVDLVTTTDSRSPAGFGGSVALAMSSGATNTKSDPLMVLTSFPGGAGPFDATIWVSKSDIHGAPVDVPTDKKQIRASVMDGTPDGTAYDLEVVDGATRVVGGRTWVQLHATITAPLAYGGFFVVRTGDGGGQFHLAAPELLAKDVTGGLSTRSLTSRFAPRPRTAAERTAIAKYRAVPPRLVPATAKKLM